MRIRTHPEEYTKEGFNNKLHTFCTLTLITNTDVEPHELYKKYKNRNEIEIMFDAYKNFLKSDRMYI